MTVETEVKGSQRVQVQGAFLGWFAGLDVSVQEIFVLS
jgi:hypothetical protein